jgi:hypothetical protein
MVQSGGPARSRSSTFQCGTQWLRSAPATETNTRWRTPAARAASMKGHRVRRMSAMAGGRTSSTDVQPASAGAQVAGCSKSSATVRASASVALTPSRNGNARCAAALAVAAPTCPRAVVTSTVMASLA